MRLIGCDRGRRAHECVPAAARTCYLQVVCVHQRKRLTLNWASGIWEQKRGDPCIESSLFLLSLISSVKHTTCIYASGSDVCMKRERWWKRVIFSYLVIMREPPGDGWLLLAHYAADNCIRFKYWMFCGVHGPGIIWPEHKDVMGLINDGLFWI